MPLLIGGLLRRLRSAYLGPEGEKRQLRLDGLPRRLPYRPPTLGPDQGDRVGAGAGDTGVTTGGIAGGGVGDIIGCGDASGGGDALGFGEGGADFGTADATGLGEGCGAATGVRLGCGLGVDLVPVVLGSPDFGLSSAPLVLRGAATLVMVPMLMGVSEVKMTLPTIKSS